MELADILKLEKGTKIYSRLDCNIVRSRWFSAIVLDKLLSKNGDVEVTVHRDSGKNWYINVNESNKQYFKLVDQEWDEEENE